MPERGRKGVGLPPSGGPTTPLLYHGFSLDRPPWPGFRDARFRVHPTSSDLDHQHRPLALLGPAIQVLPGSREARPPAHRHQLGQGAPVGDLGRTFPFAPAGVGLGLGLTLPDGRAAGLA